MEDTDAVDRMSVDDERCADLQRKVKQSVLDLIAHTGSCAFMVDIGVSDEEKLYLAFGTMPLILALMNDAGAPMPTGNTGCLAPTLVH